MLEGIKNLIKQRKAYMEAADIIMENDELDDSIILLSEGPDEADLDPEFEEDRPETPDDDEDEDKKEDDEKDDKEDDEIEDTEPEEQPMNLPGDDSLPEPIGRQTGEPVTIGDGDILNIEINLATNTQSDTLPVPPANAGDAVSDDDGILNQRIDSGFGGEESEPAGGYDIMNEPVGEEAPAEGNDDILDTPVGESCKGKECEDDDEDEDDEDEEKEEKCCNESSDDLLSEAITLGDDGGDSGDSGDIADAPIEDEAPDKDNAVTAAVKDKVSELKSSDDEVLPPDNGDTGSDGNGELKDPKSILQRLGSLTTSIENIKKGIINSLSGNKE